MALLPTILLTRKCTNLIQSAGSGPGLCLAELLLVCILEQMFGLGFKAESLFFRAVALSFPLCAGTEPCFKIGEWL